MLRPLAAACIVIIGPPAALGWSANNDSGNKPLPSAAMAPSATTADASAAAIEDPHLWLEDVLGEKQLSWVEERNAECIGYVGDPRETDCYRRIKDILDSKVRLSWMAAVSSSVLAC